MMKTQSSDRPTAITKPNGAAITELRASLQAIAQANQQASPEHRLTINALLKLVELQQQQQEATDRRLELLGSELRDLRAETRQLQDLIVHLPKKWTVRLHDPHR